MRYEKNSRFWTLILCSLLFLFVFYLYWGGRYDYPRKDQAVYMAERFFLDGDWEWFWHSLWFSRSRITHIGEYHLFRPGLMFLLSLQDIFFRGNLFISGVLSILFFAMATITLFVFLKRNIGLKISLMTALIYASQSIGIELVLWRHISPYIFSFTFGVLAFLSLDSQIKNNRKISLFPLYLFLSMCFHEYMVGATFAFLGLSAVFLAIDRKLFLGSISLKRATLGMLLAIVPYFTVYFIDFYAHNPPGLLKPPGISYDLGGLFYKILFSSISLFSATVRSSLFSSTVMNSLPGNPWRYEETDNPWIYEENVISVSFFAILGILSFGYIGVRLWKKWRKSSLTVFDLSALFWGLFLVTLIFVLIMGRGIPRSMEYVFEASYYFCLATGAWVILFSYCLKSISQWPLIQQIMGDGITRHLVLVFCLFFFGLTIILQSIYIKKGVVHYFHESAVKVTSFVKKAHRYFDRNPNYNIISRWTFDTAENKIIPMWEPFDNVSVSEILPDMLFSYHLQTKPQKTSSHSLVISTENENYFLQELRFPTMEEQEHKLKREDRYYFTWTDRLRIREKEVNAPGHRYGLFLSDLSGEYNFKVNLKKQPLHVVVSHFYDTQNFILFIIQSNRVYSEVKYEGKETVRVNETFHSFQNQEKIGVEIVHWKQYILFLVNGTLASFVEKPFSEKGRFGLLLPDIEEALPLSTVHLADHDPNFTLFKNEIIQLNEI